ncbi:MAG TPA: C39 family peptidase [Armatimonadota bacterium]|nr:C39 family peptidase [Armatimonadota bacterium]HOS44284.1 C39 family peptidase [Armatimonadota bacterium]
MRLTGTWTILLGLALWALAGASPVCAGEARIPVGPAAALTLSVAVDSIKEMREAGITLQQLDYSCGSAALATLFTAYLGQPYTEADIINFIVKSTDLQKVAARRGFSLLDLKRFAEAHGVQAEGYQLDTPGLLELNCPVLVPLYRPDTKMRHFVIFRGALGDRVFLADPAVGRQTMFRAEFERLWNPRVGMVFTHAGAPPTEETLLGVKPGDEIYIGAEALRALVMRTALQFIHQAHEY